MQDILSPYPGIRSFEPHEAAIFFGREKHIEELNQILLKQKFVAILGASGTGKSSLVKAGLIPQIKQINPDKDWRVVHLAPGQSPLDNLVQALSPLLDETKEHNDKTHSDFKRDFATNETTLFDLFATHYKVFGTYYFLYIDQFEELFRFAKSKDKEVDMWIRNLLFLQKQTLPCFLTFSLRSDYLGETVGYNGLPELINQGNYLVPKMTNDDVRVVITKPLEMFGVSITSELTEQLMNDISNSPERLLLLQHVLMRTYKEWKRNDIPENPMAKHHYQSVGTIHKAISIHGEQIYNELSQEDKLIAERIFRALLLVGTQKLDNKIPVKVNELANITEQTNEKVIELVELFRRNENAFLHPKPSVKLRSDTIIDLAHESILKYWTRGSAWMEDETNAAELYIRLAKAAELYQIGKGGVWTNPELSLALKWQKANAPNSAWAVRYNIHFERSLNFLNYSHQEHQNELRNKDEVQKRKIMFFRLFAFILGAAAIISIFLALMAVSLRFKAESSAKAALQNERLAKVAQTGAEEKSKEAISNKKVAQQQQQIAEQQKILADEQKLFAIKQQKIALEQKKIAEVKTEQATLAKNDAIVQKSAAISARKVAETQRNKADSLRGIAEKQTRISERLRKLAVARAVAIQSTKLFNSLGEQDLPKVLAKEAYTLNSNSNGPVLEPDVYLALSNFANANNIYIGHADQVRAIVTSNNEIGYTAGDDAKLLKWNFNTQTYTECLTMKEPITALTLDKKTDYVYLQAGENNIFLYAADQKKKKQLIYTTTEKISQISNTNLGLLLAEGNTIKLIQKDITNTILSHPHRVSSFAVSPDNSLLVCGLENGDLVVYKYSSQPSEVLRTKNASIVTALAFDTKNEVIALGDKNFELKLWNLSKNILTLSNIKHRSHINQIAFNPKFPILASSSYDQTLRFWNYQEGENSEPVVLPDHESWVHQIAFSPSGEYLFSVAEDRTLRKWMLHPEKMQEKIVTTRTLTPSEKEKYLGQEIGDVNAK